MLDVDDLRASFVPERIGERKRPGGDDEVDDGEHRGDQAYNSEKDSDRASHCERTYQFVVRRANVKAD